MKFKNGKNDDDSDKRRENGGHEQVSRSEVLHEKVPVQVFPGNWRQEDGHVQTKSQNRFQNQKDGCQYFQPYRRVELTIHPRNVVFLRLGLRTCVPSCPCLKLSWKRNSSIVIEHHYACFLSSVARLQSDKEAAVLILSDIY